MLGTLAEPRVYGSGRGRDADHSAPPAQIRTGGTTAYGSYLGEWRQKILAAHRAIRGTRELPHCVGNVSDRTMFLLGPRPSLPNLRGRQVLVVRLVHRYYGAVRLLLNVHVRRSVYHLRGPVLIFRPRRPGDLPVLVHVVSQRARVLRLRRTGWTLASKRGQPCCLPRYVRRSAS